MIAEQNQLLPEEFYCENKKAIQIKMVFSEDKPNFWTGTYQLISEIFLEYKQHVKQIGIEKIRIEDREQIYSKYYDQQCTINKRQLLNSIKQFLANNDYEYNILFLFGHGAPLQFQGQQKQTYFLWFYHNKLQFISFSQILSLWLPEKTKHLLIIYNGCKSGNWVKQLRNSPKRASITIISSCTQNQISTIKYMDRDKFKELIRQVSSQQLKIGLSYFCIAFFGCLIQKFMSKQTTSQIIAEIKKNNKNPENYQTFISVGFMQIIQDICHDQKIALDNQNRRIQFKASANNTYNLQRKKEVSSIFTGDKRFIDVQSQQNTKCGIFHKRGYQVRQKRKIIKKPFLFYEGGYNRFQFHGFGRATIQKKHSFGRYIRRRHTKKINLGYSQINGQTLTKSICNTDRDHIIQQWHLNQISKAQIPQNPQLINTRFQIDYKRIKYDGNTQELQYLNFNNRKDNIVNNILTLKMTLDSTSRTNVNIWAINKLVGQDFKYINKYQLNDYRDKKFTGNNIRILRVTIQNQISGRINLTCQKKQKQQIRSICFQIPHQFQYKNILDQILLKRVQYVFEVYKDKSNKNMTSIYYTQSINQYQKYISVFTKAKFRAYLTLYPPIQSMMQSLKKTHKNNDQLKKYEKFINSNISTFAKQIYKVVYENQNQIERHLENKLNQHLEKCQQEKDPHKKNYIEKLFKEVISFINNQSNKKQLQEDVSQDNHHMDRTYN